MPSESFPSHSLIHYTSTLLEALTIYMKDFVVYWNSQWVCIPKKPNILLNSMNSSKAAVPNIPFIPSISPVVKHCIHYHVQLSFKRFGIGFIKESTYNFEIYILIFHTYIQYNTKNVKNQILSSWYPFSFKV